ncbi:FecR family protein [Pedobacter nanyangensis]|uniref:FecR family protein n=1 Tax=Pedobacter nanyangensis TaxID=1562389 RepID=UPI000DE1BEEA|nr:FecR family protein [Pedobacter nanyangensis]
MSKHSRIAYEIIERYNAGTCTLQEKAMVEQWYETIETPDFDLPEERMEEVLYEAWKGINAAKKRVRQQKTWRRIAVAASVLLVVGIGIYTMLGRNNQTITDSATAIASIKAGTPKAMLTLSNGERISLADAQQGKLADDGGTEITKTADGEIIYTPQAPKGGAIGLNTIETPKGGEYQIVLPDGTKVWLNAASTLKYPASFGALNERRVTLSGEAYFEVAHNKAKPFKVVSAGQTVEVLGTHFNINSYADEERTLTTLAEGSVQVALSNGSTEKLKPDQQAINTGNKLNVQPADLQTTLAWKNGKMYFKKADLPTIMRQVARWYNIEIQFKGDPSKQYYTGGVARSSNLATLLKIFQSSGIHFSIENTPKGKILIIEP